MSIKHARTTHGSALKAEIIDEFAAITAIARTAIRSGTTADRTLEILSRNADHKARSLGSLAAGVCSPTYKTSGSLKKTGKGRQKAQQYQALMAASADRIALYRDRRDRLVSLVQSGKLARSARKAAKSQLKLADKAYQRGEVRYAIELIS